MLGIKAVQSIQQSTPNFNRPVLAPATIVAAEVSITKALVLCKQTMAWPMLGPMVHLDLTRSRVLRGNASNPLAKNEDLIKNQEAM